MTSESKADLIQPWRNLLLVQSISTKLSGQFLPWLKNNFMKFWGCGMPNFTAMPIFQQICLGMPEAHTVFYQCSASTASRLSRIFFKLIHNSKKINFQHISIQKVCIINNKTWIWRSGNLRSMEHLDEKWPQIAKVDLIQP